MTQAVRRHRAAFMQGEALDLVMHYIFLAFQEEFFYRGGMETH